MRWAWKRSSQRLLGDQRLEPGDHLGVAPGGELGVDRQLERPQVKLLEPADLGPGEGLGGDVGERGAAPELERGAGRAVRADRPPGSRAASSTRCSKRSASTASVGQPELVAAAAGDDARPLRRRRPNALRSCET